MLVSTKEAAIAMELSEYELRTGYRQGKYPALEVGRGTRAKHLRWNLDKLREAVDQIMDETQNANRIQEEKRRENNNQNNHW